MLLLTVLSGLVTCVAGFSYFVTKFFYFNAAKLSDSLNHATGVDQDTPVYMYAPPPAPRKAKRPVDFGANVVALHGAPRPSTSATTRVIPVVEGRDPASVAAAKALQSHRAMSAMLAWVDADEG